MRSTPQYRPAINRSHATESRDPYRRDDKEFCGYISKEHDIAFVQTVGRRHEQGMTRKPMSRYWQEQYYQLFRRWN